MAPIVSRVFALTLATVSMLAAALPVTATDEIPWSTNIEESLREAAAAGKPVLLEFTAPWCVYCKRMEKTTFTDRAVVSRISEHFVAVRVDADKNKDLVADLGIQGLPAILIVSPDLQIIERISGFQTAAALVAKLDGVRASRTPSVADRRVASAAGAAPKSGIESQPQAELDFEPLTPEATAASRRPSVRPVSKQFENASAKPAAANSATQKSSESDRFFESVNRAADTADATPAFGGLCVVSAVDDRELVDGTPQCQLEYRGHLLRFRSEDQKQKFLAHPAEYWPMHDGTCAITLLNSGERIEGKLQYAAAFRKRIWLFTSEKAMREFLLDPSEVAEEIAEQSASTQSR